MFLYCTIPVFCFRSTGAKSEASVETFNVVEPDVVNAKHYTGDTQIYSNSKYSGGHTYRVNDMNYRNQHTPGYTDTLR